MYKVLVIFGTRPEAIKMAPLIKELKSRPAIDLKVCITAQHRDLLDQVLENYSITPDYDLNIMKQNQTLEEITSRVLTGVGSIIEEIKPDIVLVHGDTTTSFAAALSAFYHQVLIGHIEAGLRTYDKYQPFPEELNRQMISNLEDLNFAPTKLSYQNLKNEQKDLKGIFVTGNTAIDAMKLTIKKDYQNEEIPNLDSKKTLL